MVCPAPGCANTAGALRQYRRFCQPARVLGASVRTVIELQDGARATIRAGAITASDPVLAEMLDVIRSDLSRGYRPDPDWEIARQYVERFGGRIVSYAGPPGRDDPSGTVY